MVAQAPSGKKPLPDMITSIRIDKSGQVEIVDQLLLPSVAISSCNSLTELDLKLRVTLSQT